ncbi:PLASMODESMATA CALLOSE-BINDING PROTEIN 2 isoform X2 [Malania oleifera]|nr:PLASMODESMATA CALLOSE-BINDING PROTEIN 2 isoform X2 [Malania oleifera]
MLFTSTESTTQMDATPGTIPIVNPSTPTTATPIVNPTTPPLPPTPTTPTTTPTTPTTTPTPTTTTPTPTTTTPTTTPTTPTSSGGTWCIANPSASQTALQVALDYACGYGGSDCSVIQPSGSCYNPNTIHDHASYAFNDYYQKNPAPTSCVFGGTAQLTYTDPSSGSCHYASSSTSPASPTPPTPPTPPSTSSPLTPSTPSGSTIYGSEPSATPSSAACVSRSLVLVFAATCLLVPVVAANYL